MTKRLTIGLLAVAVSPIWAQNNWVLAQSTLTYHVSHPLHQTDGVSHAARGKGVCSAGKCDFLIAAPVKSFDSGDSNRDLHMLQVTRGAQFPMVTVRTSLPEPAVGVATLQADLEIQFAGQTALYKQVLFQVVMQGKRIHISGTVPATLSDFKNRPPIAADVRRQERDSRESGPLLGTAVKFEDIVKLGRGCLGWTCCAHGFHHPRAHRYGEYSAVGYYEDAFDYRSNRGLPAQAAVAEKFSGPVPPGVARRPLGRAGRRSSGECRSALGPAVRRRLSFFDRSLILTGISGYSAAANHSSR